MDGPDLNLLSALDALLAEETVAGAARRLGLSPSAMSRTLARLRAVTGDPLLVRAGRVLVPTPRATELRDEVHDLLRGVRTVLSPCAIELDLTSLERTFTLRTNEGFLQVFGEAIVTAVTSAAPRVRIRFAPKPFKEASPLRDGRVDLEVGVLGEFAPEVRSTALFRNRFVGIAREDHPMLRAPITPESYAAARHVVASRKGVGRGPVDEALEALGLHRDVAVVLPGFPSVMRLARSTDLLGLVPISCLGVQPEREEPMATGLSMFDIPVSTPEITVSAMWHPRLDADLGHRWLRQLIVSLCREQERPRP